MKNYTHISVVLDKSGSMSSCVNDTIGGFNQFLKTQGELEGKATITLAQFNDHYDLVMDMKPLSGAENLDSYSYVPAGNTALLDAIGRTINSVEGKIEDMAKKSRPEKVIFVIITDGEENSSREFNRDQIMEMINSHKEKNKWEFVFIGANQDSIQAGSKIGVRSTSTLNYTQDTKGITTMYCSLSKGMSDYRTRSLSESENAAFFSPDNNFFADKDAKK